MKKLKMMLVVAVLAVCPCNCVFASLINGDAELGGLTGWGVSSYEIVYVVGSQLQGTGTVYPNQGDYFFSFGKAPSSYAMISQSGLVQAGSASLTLGGFFQSEYFAGAINDSGIATITVFDEAGNELSTKSTPNMTSAAFHWIPFTVSTELAPNSYSWEVTLEGFLHYGSYVNSFYDDIYLTPEPCTLMLLGLGGLLLRKRKA